MVGQRPDTWFAGPPQAIRLVMQGTTNWDPSGGPRNPDGTAICTSCRPGTPVSSNQYRINVFSAPGSGTYAMYAAATGGSPLGWVTAIAGQTFFLRETSGGNLPNGTYILYFTTRFICTTGTYKAWRCRVYRAQVIKTANNSAGIAFSNAGSHPTTPGPYCDSPPP